MKVYGKKSFLHRGLYGVIACLLLFGVFAQPLYAAGITLELPRNKLPIMFFERQNPVYSMIVEEGTEIPRLELPRTLRAVRPLENIRMENFVQARPQPGLLDGTDDYDYYYYGYVAPRGAEELYKKQEPVVYTIYYAEDSHGTAEAYRVYGSMGGGENAWYVCSSDGTITGEIEEVPVSWDTGNYDGNRAGTYVLKGKVRGKLAEECESPAARVEVRPVNRVRGGFTAGAVMRTAGEAMGFEETGTGADGHAQIEVETEPNKEPGAAQGNEKPESEGESPADPDGETGEGPEGDGEDTAHPEEEKEQEAGKDSEGEGEEVPGTEEEPHAEEEPGEAEEEEQPEGTEGSVLFFEALSPAARRKVEKGTLPENIRLPGELAAVSPMEEPEEESFLQEEPKEEDARKRGYEAPEDEAELRELGERVIYTYRGTGEEAFLRNLLESLTGETEGLSGTESQEEPQYRIYGAVGEEEAAWYACNEEGTITGRICMIPVTYDFASCDMETGGVYRVPAMAEAELAPETEMPYAEVEVMDPECNCGVDEGSRPWEHWGYCPCFEPIQCMCEVDDKEDHDESNQYCPLYGKDIIEICRPDGMTPVWVMIEDLNFFLGRGYSVSEEPRVLYAVNLMSSNSGGGSNDQAQDNYMRSDIAKSNNQGYLEDGEKGDNKQIDGAWITYLNSVWMNQVFSNSKFDYLTDKEYEAVVRTEWDEIKEEKASSLSQTIWNGTVAYATASNGLTPQNNRFVVPQTINGICRVYSPHQLLYAVRSCASGTRIQLASSMNLNGDLYAWPSVIDRNRIIYLDGQGYTLYNLGICNGGKGTDTVFAEFKEGSKYQKIAFSNAKVIGGNGLNIIDGKYCSTSLFGCIGNDALENIYVKNSLIYGGHWTGVLAFVGNKNDSLKWPAAGEAMVQDSEMTSTQNYIKNCYVDSCAVYGTEHVGGLVACPNQKRISNSYVKDSTIVGIRHHVGGFASCMSGTVEVTECFTSNVEVYAAANAGGFVGFTEDNHLKFTNCFSSGILKGYFVCGGFAGDIEAEKPSSKKEVTTFQTCYSTVLTYLGKVSNSNYGTVAGGFIGRGRIDKNYPDLQYRNITFDSCYAAGEVGTYTMDTSASSNSLKAGGFIGEEEGSCTYRYCYYDKQTTAMREWASGNWKGSVTSSIDTAGPRGIRGVLTSGTKTSKSGAGLADGSVYTSAHNPSDPGFAGFGSGSWTSLTGRYPEIFALYYASGGYVSKWKGPNGSESPEIAGIVTNASKASVQTVKLNTWESGYDWGSEGTGIRSSGTVSFKRNITENKYQGTVNTYDTVRDITSGGSVYNYNWKEMISGGVKASFDYGNTEDTSGRAVGLSGLSIQVERPGQNWFQYATSQEASAGRRPIRLIGLMKAEAGSNKEVLAGQYYSHRSNQAYRSQQNTTYPSYGEGSPYFGMVNTVEEGLVMGTDNGKMWSQANMYRYPTSTLSSYSGLNYNGAALSPSTSIPSGKSTKLYTEILRQGTNTKVYGLNLTGTADAAGKRARDRWNARLPMYTDLALGRKYTVTYYWLLKDGRYVTDSRTVNVKPASYKLEMFVRDSVKKNTSIGSALYLRANQGRTSPSYDSSAAYPLGSITAHSRFLSDIPFRTNAVAAWRAKEGYQVTGLRLELYNEKDVIVKSAEISGGITSGRQISLSGVPRYYYEIKNGQEYSQYTTDTLTYTVSCDAVREVYYLSFNQTAGTVNDMRHNVKVYLYVEPLNALTVKKTVEDGFGDKAFDIRITLKSPSGAGYVGSVSYTGGGEARTLSFVNGEATAKLKHGESVTIPDIPRGYTYTVEETEESRAGYSVRYQSGGTVKESSEFSGTFSTSTTGPIQREVEVINSVDRAVGINIYKEIEGEEAGLPEPEREFQIEVLLSKEADYGDRTLWGTAPYYKYDRSSGEPTGSGTAVFQNGTAVIPLRAGEFAELLHLPYNYYYRVWETEESQEGFEVTYDWPEYQLTNREGETNNLWTAGVINTPKPGSLSIEKEVYPDYLEPGKAYEMEVTLKEGTGKGYTGTLPCVIGGEEVPITFREGKGRVSLKHGEKAVIGGIPQGYSYEVEEAEESQDKYRVYYYRDGEACAGNKAEGSIRPESLDEEVKVQNYRGWDLQIEKAIDEKYQETLPDLEYEIEVRFSKDADFLDKSFEEPLRYRKWKGAEEKPAEEGELSFREGAAVVKLRAGESITIENVPVDYHRKVTESESSQTGFTAEYDYAGYAPYICVTNIPNPGTLTIGKEVRGETKEPDRAYGIRIHLSPTDDREDERVSGAYPCTGMEGMERLVFEKGEARVSLRAGEQISILGIPAGYHYWVEEEEESREGFQVSYIKNGEEAGETNEAESGPREESCAWGAFPADLKEPRKEEITVVNEKLKELRIRKEAQENGEGLRGAEFTLYRLKDPAKAEAVKESFLDPEKPDPDTWLLIGSVTSSPEASFAGLEEGFYRLAETRVPEGRAAPEVQWNLWIDERGEMEFTDTNGIPVPVKKEAEGKEAPLYVLENQKIYQLPEAGGPGTYVFTTGGFAIMMTALLLFIKKKQKEADKEER